MKARGRVLVGFLSVLAAAFVIVATCCLCIDFAQAACTSCSNCSPNARGGCASGSSNAACDTHLESCNTCGCADRDPGVGVDCKCQ
jgi:hypothetical protein